MSADPIEEQQALERATAAADLAGAELTPETQALREGWLAFGQLLESTQPLEAPKPERPMPARRTRRWPLLVVVATAVCVLICMDAARIWNYMNPSEGVSPSPAAVAVTKATQPAADAKQPSEAAVVNELAWDDSLDEQIAQVGQTMIALQPSWSDRSGAFDAVQYDLQQVQKEIEGEKL
jgi:hypothetical protein